MKIKLVAPFKVDGLDSEGCLELPTGASITDLIASFGLRRAYAWVMPVSVNGEVVSKNHRIEDGDTVVFIFPAAGG